MLTMAANASIGTSDPVPLVLDNSYGIDGLARTSSFIRMQFPRALMASLADGKVLIASEAGYGSSNTSLWQITRLNANGTVDRAFGINGVVTTSFVNGTESNPRPFSIAIQPNGDFLVGGRFGSGSGRGILARYKANGTLDPTFGTGGIADLNSLHGISTAGVSDIALRADGRILLGFTENGAVTGVIAQLNFNGTFDATFGNGGVSRMDSVYHASLSTSEIEILQDESFLIGGNLRSQIGVARVQPNGLGLVTSFGNNGVASAGIDGSLISPSRMQVDSQGRVVYSASATAVVGGVSQPADFAVARFLPNGAVDTSFGSNGMKLIDVAVGGRDTPTNMIIHSDGKITIGGVSVVANVYDSALIRLNEDGTLDASFDLDGLYRNSLVNTSAADMIYDIVQQDDGKLLALTGWGNDVRVAQSSPCKAPYCRTHRYGLRRRSNRLLSGVFNR